MSTSTKIGVCVQGSTSKIWISLVIPIIRHRSFHSQSSVHEELQDISIIMSKCKTVFFGMRFLLVNNNRGILLNTKNQIQKLCLIKKKILYKSPWKTYRYIFLIHSDNLTYNMWPILEIVPETSPSKVIDSVREK